MLSMELFKHELFKQNTNGVKGSFLICTDKGNYMFMQCQCGEATYIYGDSDRIDGKFYTKIDLEPELKAIVKGNKIYIIDDYLFDLSHISEDVIFLDKYVEKCNNYIAENLWKDFYETLEEINIDEDINKCQKEARSLLLKNKTLDFPELPFALEPQDVVNSLCGFLNLEKKAIDKLNADVEKLRYEKTFYLTVKKMIENKENVTEDEMRLASALTSLCADNVNVFFNFNGQTFDDKISVYKILDILDNKECFQSYNFSTTKKGQKILKKIGASNASWDKNSLKCKHIIKISYRGKALYEK